MIKQLLALILFTTLWSYAQSKVSLQVLGSGGPESGDKRASSGYIVWIDGKSKVLVDFGGGTSLRFEEVGAHIKDVDVILLTHLHVDHTADLPALLKSSFFTKASGNLHIFGPDNNNFMPSTKDFVNRLFDDDNGVWQYLGDHLNGDASLQLKAHNIAMSKKEKVIYKQGEISISAVSVHHGPIPAVAYRVNVGKKSVTFSGDMNGDYHTLDKLGSKTDILVMHNAVPKNAKGVATKLHMTPLIIGEIAKKAEAKSVVISHRMLRTLGKEKETNCEIRRNYEGDIEYANDKDKYKIL
ncbi:MBL fold metallo-hydrolase [Sulfurovum sp.]|uniref:MBL fold metallo-hydrolase n=1 Tax=Sulfurovum sp. TaxID=1969726 RepID=UPI002867EF67|nr:MBL fold metallo-hydrolase [Sulfurovum sp.]